MRLSAARNTPTIRSASIHPKARTIAPYVSRTNYFPSRWTSSRRGWIAMSANESLHKLAAERFMTDGLGGRLSRNGRLINPGASGIEPMYRAASTVCGNIAERVLWAGLGWWLGCFEQIEAITLEERTFLEEHSQLLKKEECRASTNISSVFCSTAIIQGRHSFRSNCKVQTFRKASTSFRSFKRPM